MHTRISLVTNGNDLRERKKYSFTDAVRFQTFGARPSNIDLLTMSLYLLSEMVCFM